MVSAGWFTRRAVYTGNRFTNRDWFSSCFRAIRQTNKKINNVEFFYWTSLANNCSPFERKVLFKMLFSCFQLDFEITVTLEWIEWVKCYELFGSLKQTKPKYKKNNNNKQSMTDALAWKWCRRVIRYVELLFPKLYLFKISLIISIISVGNHVYVLNNPNHQKSYKEITMIVLLVAELQMQNSLNKTRTLHNPE